MSDTHPHAAPPDGEETLQQIPAPGADAPDVEEQNSSATPVLSPVSAASPPRRSGLIGPVVGGAIAAGIGFGLSHFNLLGLAPAAPDPTLLTRLEAAEARLSEGLQASATAADQAKATAEAAEKSASDARAQLQSAPWATALSPLDTRIAALEQALAQAARTGGDPALSQAALATLGADLARLQAQVQNLGTTSGADPAEIARVVDQKLADWEAEARARVAAETKAAEAAAARQAALLSLREAATTGAPFAAALQALSLTNPPEVLTRNAETGLPTLAALRDTFPDAARKSLDASLRAAGSEGGDRFWAFLRIQTGARSLTPQEGSDPDAILSRAEAALAADDLPKALAEIDSLPPAGQAPLADWSARARDLLAAREALAALTAAPQPAPPAAPPAAP